MRVQEVFLLVLAIFQHQPWARVSALFLEKNTTLCPTTCASFLANYSLKYFPRDSPLFVMVSESREDCISESIVRYLQSSYILTLVQIPATNEAPDGITFLRDSSYLMLIDSRNTLLKALNYVTKCLGNNEKSKFIVISSVNMTVPDQEFVVIKSWQYKILNLIIINGIQVCEQLLKGELKETFPGLTYSPFSNSTYKCQSEFESKCMNLYGYPITITSFPNLPYELVNESTSGVVIYSGAGGKIFETFIRYMNATALHIIQHRQMNLYGNPLSNGTWTGIVGDINQAKVDLGFNSMFITEARTKVVDFTVFTGMTEVVFLVPKSGTVPFWRASLTTFQVDTWYCILGVFVFVMGAFLVCGVLLQKRNNITLDKNKTVFYLFSICMSQSVERKPKNMTFRVMFIIFVYFVLIISSIYQGWFVEKVTAPAHWKEINSIQEIVDSKLKVTSYTQVIRNLIVNSVNPLLQKLKYRLVEFRGFSNVFNQIARKRDLTLFGTKPFLKYMLQFEIGAESHDIYHVVEERVAFLSKALPVSKGFPCLERMSTLILRMHEVGLSDKWWMDFVNRCDHLHKENVLAGPASLTVLHLQVAFFILPGGLSLSFSLFLCELFVKFCQTHVAGCCVKMRKK